jgi:hypothetical protein
MASIVGEFDPRRVPDEQYKVRPGSARCNSARGKYARFDRPQDRGRKAAGLAVRDEIRAADPAMGMEAHHQRLLGPERHSLQPVRAFVHRAAPGPVSRCVPTATCDGRGGLRRATG